MDLTHASFFSGVGGLDLGLERAGWRTVSFSEIDPYASAVLTERWPGVPNLGDITSLAGFLGAPRSRQSEGGRLGRAGGATLWSGGFPCQDLSVAGKRAGFAGERSSLAFAFLDLVERHRPPAILLENVPGLLSSNGGRDFGRLLAEVGNLGYWWAYRILDAQFFGVPQRRRRVFVVALNSESGFGADSAAAVLSVGSRCDGHLATGDEARKGVAERTTVGALPAGVHGFPDGVQEFMQGHFRVVSSSPDPGGVREADGLAGRLDDSWELAHAGENSGRLGLDSHRYRCCGNGVVSNVSEWIGVRLARAMQ